LTVSRRFIIDGCAANVLISLREMTEEHHLAERDEYIGRAALPSGHCKHAAVHQRSRRWFAFDVARRCP
jgi:hypothetical protein